MNAGAHRLPRMARMLGAGQLLAAAAALSLVGGTLLAYQFVTLRHGLQAGIGIHAQVLGENISAPLMFGDREAAADILNAFQADPALVDAVIYDAGGREFVAFRRNTAAPSTLAQLAPGWFGPVVQERPIVHGGRRLGGMLLRAETDAISTSLQNYGVLFGLASAGALLASALISRRSRLRVARAEAKLAYLAYTDPVTGLPNRRGGQEELDAALAQARESGGSVGLVLIDLDNFKVVNDSAGHAAGDQLLHEVGARLRAAARPGDLVGRFGGDEFIVIARPLASSDALRDIAEALMEALRRPIQLDATEVTVTGSAGTCVFPQDAANASELMCNADAALYHAKGGGRNRVGEFKPAMMHATQRRARLERDLRRALETDGLAVFYQPQFDCATERMVGVEALLRWMHPEHGFIGPDEFIPVAEECGLIVAIGEWVLERACRDAVDLGRRSGAPLHVAVNVSARQFREKDFVRSVERILAETGLPPHRLELELTESMLMEDRGAAIDFMHAVRALGVRMSIDDFGTGYSSLSYLQSFPINQLKIDRSFVRPLPADGQMLAGAVIGLAHDFGLTVVAEGVEDRAQLAWLQRAGCDYAQGYLLGRPMPLSALAARLLEEPVAVNV
ncbi:bifunctional diguanylate cyclase/phosphodiesterase [Massilia sp. ST3]|uniref:putative bifunctional diguanylate cyclase/phosphodiesterase n=1 Tax=Massilia sp. ST3 TaxID=2824903 RepID=UPI001B83680A|nr:EAL domain-containing protein [Massilia sp. ST3]MBQ5949385.1 EAL domain-containing protein [Massilia sp. ST3]